MLGAEVDIFENLSRFLHSAKVLVARYECRFLFRSTPPVMRDPRIECEGTVYLFLSFLLKHLLEHTVMRD